MKKTCLDLDKLDLEFMTNQYNTNTSNTNSNCTYTTELVMKKDTRLDFVHDYHCINLHNTNTRLAQCAPTDTDITADNLIIVTCIASGHPNTP